MKEFKIKPKDIEEKLINFISRTVRAKGFDKVIIGLSGGLDSSTVACLAKKALGEDNVIAVIMPYGRLSQPGERDGKKLARMLRLKTEYVDISHMVDAYFSKVKYMDNVRKGNKMARERMSILYDLSKKYNALVIGTSNKTEILLGYGTLYGDTACALNPIGGLYKTQLKPLAKYLGLPAYIRDKVPTAGLWHGQTDEDELGYRYKDIDRLLFFMVDKRLTDRQLLKKGFSRKFVSDIRKRIKDNRFKCKLPKIARI
jgi:NAD+ synthase